MSADWRDDREQQQIMNTCRRCLAPILDTTAGWVAIETGSMVCPSGGGEHEPLRTS